MKNVNDYTNPIDAYNFYKKNTNAAQEIISSLNFKSAQDLGAKVGQKFMFNSNQNNMAQNAMTNNQNKILGINKSLVSGLLVGAGVALVATNPKVQKAVVGTATKLLASLQGHIEEMKEQIHDAKAEMSEEE